MVKIVALTMFRTTRPRKCANNICFNSQSRWRVHCNDHHCYLSISFSDGVGRSGTFCAILSIIERLKSEQVIDVCQSVKVIRVNRPKAVNSKVGLYHCLHHKINRHLPTLQWISFPCLGTGVVTISSFRQYNKSGQPPVVPSATTVAVVGPYLSLLCFSGAVRVLLQHGSEVFGLVQ